MTQLRDPTRAPFATLLRNPALYQRWLERRFPHTHGTPSHPGRVPAENGVLLTRDEVEQWAQVVRDCGLPEHTVAARNWDALAAFGAVTSRTGPAARVLDVGGRAESVVSLWLWLAGYRELWGVSPAYRAPFQHAAIHYRSGDATATRFEVASFDAVTCLSVVEHGVDLDSYFREAARILKPGGVVVTSTDYFPEPIDTNGVRAYGTDVKIFTRDDIEAVLRLAAAHGLEPSGPVPLDADEKPVHWDLTDLDYTFVVFTLVKGADVT